MLLYLSLYVGDWACVAIGDSSIGAVGTAGTRSWSAVAKRRNWTRSTERTQIYKYNTEVDSSAVQAKMSFTFYFYFWKIFIPVKMEKSSLCSPDISMALFLKVLMTVPSFLRRSGELRLSATFCFNRERTFRLGSETGQVRKRTRSVVSSKPKDHCSLFHWGPFKICSDWKKTLKCWTSFIWFVAALFQLAQAVSVSFFLDCSKSLSKHIQKLRSRLGWCVKMMSHALWSILSSESDESWHYHLGICPCRQDITKDSWAHLVVT